MMRRYEETMMKKRVLVLGASGMLGSAMVRWFDQFSDYDVFGSVRGLGSVRNLQEKLGNAQFVPNVDVESIDSLTRLFAEVQPNVVINCIGIVKQLIEADDPLVAIPINSLLPHRLARLAEVAGARLVHISTDCVFSGRKGNYLETDNPDAYDIYGRSKLLGEVDYPNAITLRTSIIGHELGGARSLIDWFLSQEKEIKGYKNAVFSGFPTVEIARIIHEFVIPNPQLHGLYHLSAEPINKFDLLTIVSKVYGKKIDIQPDETLVIDRSLNSDRFRSSTGFTPDPWLELIKNMHAFH